MSRGISRDFHWGSVPFLKEAIFYLSDIAMALQYNHPREDWSFTSDLRDLFPLLPVTTREGSISFATVNNVQYYTT